MVNASRNSTKAIIVDDSATMRSLLNAIVTADGVEVVSQLSGGQKLLQTISLLSPNMVFLDYNLPDSNGIELLKSIVSAHPQVAVLIITGEDDQTIRGAAAEYGAAGFIRKPFTQEQISNELKQIVQIQTLMDDMNKSAEPVNTDVSELDTRPTAVIADDSKSIRSLLVAILSNAGLNVAGEAVNGTQAVEMVALLKPDIVCLDIDMPVLNGIEALKQIRTINPATKVLMITGNSSREMVTASIKEGATGFVVKPLNVEKVSAVISKVLAI